MKQLLLKFVDALNLYPLFNKLTRNTATIFMLHSIHPVANKRSDITTSLLDQYLGYLQKHNYRVISLADFVQAIKEKRNTSKSVVFTVDDGYRDFYLHAFSVFRKYGYPATIFLTGDFIDKRLFMWWDKIEYAFQTSKHSVVDLEFIGMGQVQLGDLSQRSQVALDVTRYCKHLSNDDKLSLIDKLLEILGVDTTGQPKGKYEPLSWDEIKEMMAGGINFHPHTKTHPIMTSIPREQKVVEITESRKLIETQLGVKADIFCYPNGQWEDLDDETIEVLKSSGYVAAVTGMEGFDNTLGNPDLFKLRRYPIPYQPVRFKQYVSGIERLKNRVSSNRS